MSNNENGDLNETENNVEGASSDKNADDSGDVGHGKDVPSNEELRNSDENVGLGSDEKDVKMDDAAQCESGEKDVAMEDAAKCKDAASDVVVAEEENEKNEEEKNGEKEEERSVRYSEESVADGVDVVMPDAKNVEAENGNQDAVEVTVSVKDASVGDILKSSNGKEIDGEEAQLESKDNGGDDAKDVSITTTEGGDVDLLSQKSFVVKSEDDQKGDELKKDGTLEVKPLASTNETDSNVKPLETKAEGDEKGHDLKKEATKMDLSPQLDVKKEGAIPKLDLEPTTEMKTPNNSFLLESADGYESGTEEEQVAFLKDVERFHRENNLEFKPPKFYKEELNLLKLWRSVIKLGGYEQVTSCKLWRQVGESFKPPKTCTTVSWTFRIFYEKALLEYEKGKLRNGELPFPDGTMPEAIRDENQGGGSQALGSGRARRDAAARAMQGWHSQRVLSNGQVSQPIIKDKNLSTTPKIEKPQKSNGLLKRKKPSSVERMSVSHVKTVKQQLGGDSMVIDIGPPADWVKINVQRTNDCFEVYALVPGLLREEVHVQSDPAGRLIISGQPEHLDNPWGVTPFKKVVSLPSRIDPHQTSAVVTLHGQLFVRVPFEQSDV